MVGELAKCMADPARREECIEDITNRVLVQERNLSYALQVSFPQKQTKEAINKVESTRNLLRFLARDLGYKGKF